MKENKALIITNIILLGCIIIGLLVFMIFGLNGKITFWGGENKLTQKLEFNDINNNVLVDVKSYDIEIIESSTDKIEVEVYGNEKTKNNVIITNNGSLEIKQKKSTLCFGFCYSAKIIIKLPTYYQGKFNLNTISGDIKSNISFKDIENNVSTTSGDIELLDVLKGKITSTSGEISINYLSDGKVKTTSGDIEIKTVENGDISSTSGEIDIDNFTGFGDIGTVSGDIKIDRFEILGNSSLSSTSGEVKVKLINDAYIIAESVSGDKDIKASRGEYELRAKTISGDITIK